MAATTVAGGNQHTFLDEYNNPQGSSIPGNMFLTGDNRGSQRSQNRNSASFNNDVHYPQDIRDYQSFNNGVGIREFRDTFAMNDAFAKMGETDLTYLEGSEQKNYGNQSELRFSSGLNSGIVGGQHRLQNMGDSTVVINDSKHMMTYDDSLIRSNARNSSAKKVNGAGTLRSSLRNSSYRQGQKGNTSNIVSMPNSGHRGRSSSSKKKYSHVKPRYLDHFQTVDKSGGMEINALN